MLRKGGEKMSNEWLTINELSGRLKVSIKTVRNRMADGLPYHKIGGALRFDYDDVVEWIKTCKVEEVKNVSKSGRAKSLRSKNKPDNDLFSVIKNDSSLSADMKTALLGFAAMRKEIKKPLTQRGYALLLKKLNELTKNESEQIKILEDSTMNCWQGVFPLKNKNMPPEEKTKNEFAEYEEFCRTQGVRAGKIS